MALPSYTAVLDSSFGFSSSKSWIETYPAVAFTIKFGVGLSIVIVSGRGRSFERLPLKIALQQD
ncbi:MAG: hypothetical protein DMG15_21175 [Acidobacteria bacterium]|nr:MAG: hypothetical protein DMG16_09510 [Acidobacteriota bacterium]PYS10317.1 MAG: hypothetical protein DMG15_21175 [Acidobacteriota bacterium]